MRSDKTLKRYYRLINKKFFHNELPNNVCVAYTDGEYIDEERYFGWCDNGIGRHKYVLYINREKNPGFTAVLATLAHEMCHLGTSLRDDHGPAFEAQRQKIADRGIFKKGAVLKGLTIF